jgi:hypothetical protein
MQFMMDSFKNCSGAASIHISNLFFATLLSPVFGRGYCGSNPPDQCHLYFIEIMIDTTIGVYVEFFLLTHIIHGLKYFEFNQTATDLSAHATTALNQSQTDEYRQLDSAEMGILDSSRNSHSWIDIDWVKYFKQIILWLFVVTLMKGVMVCILMFEAPQLVQIAHFLLSRLDSKPQTELVVVMVITPVIMNSLQFWLQDNIFVEAARRAQLEKDQQIMAAESRNMRQEALRHTELLQSVEERSRAAAERQAEAERNYAMVRSDSMKEHNRQRLYIAHLHVKLIRQTRYIDSLETRQNKGYFGAVVAPLVQRRGVSSKTLPCDHWDAAVGSSQV